MKVPSISNKETTKVVNGKTYHFYEHHMCRCCHLGKKRAAEQAQCILASRPIIKEVYMVDLNSKLPG